MNNGITAAELEKLDNSEYTIIDIRDSSAFEYGHMDGAVNIAQEDILSAELPQDKKLIICCRSGIISRDIADKLCEKGLLENRNGIVTSRIPRETFYAQRSETVVTRSFHGSLPAFVASFISNKELSRKDADEIRRMLDAYMKEE